MAPRATRWVNRCMHRPFHNPRTHIMILNRPDSPGTILCMRVLDIVLRYEKLSSVLLDTPQDEAVRELARRLTRTGCSITIQALSHEEVLAVPEEHRVTEAEQVGIFIDPRFDATPLSSFVSMIAERWARDRFGKKLGTLGHAQSVQFTIFEPSGKAIYSWKIDHNGEHEDARPIDNLSGDLYTTMKVTQVYPTDTSSD